MLFKKPTPPTLLLESYSINESSNDGQLIQIIGNRTGIFAWIMDKLGIRNRKFIFKYYQDHIVIEQGGKLYEIIPSRDVFKSTIGYSNNKLLLIMAVLATLLGVLVLLAGLIDGKLAQGLTGFVFNGIISAILFYLFKRSGAIEFSLETQNNLNLGIRIKSGITGKEIDKSDMERMKNIIFSSLSNSSRWYNKHYN